MEILKIVGGTAFLLAAVGWLIRSIILHFLDKDVATFKVELQRQAMEHEIRFRRVDEKVAEHLSGVYGRLFRFYEAVHSFSKILEREGEPSKQEKFSVASDANREFWSYLLDNRLYVPRVLYDRVHELANKLCKIVKDVQEAEKKGDSDNAWLIAIKALEDEATPLFSGIVDEFQRRLGVADEAATQATPDILQLSDSTGERSA